MDLVAVPDTAIPAPPFVVGRSQTALSAVSR
jgi:hypothetical protein